MSAEDFHALRDNWDMHDGEDMLTETVDYDLAGEPYPLLDRFPPLRLSLEPGHDDVMVQPCKRLEVLTSTPTGQQSRPLPQYLDERTIFVTADDDREVLAQVARALDATFKPDVVLRRMEEQRRNQAEAGHRRDPRRARQAAPRRRRRGSQGRCPYGRPRRPQA